LFFSFSVQLGLLLLLLAFLRLSLCAALSSVQHGLSFPIMALFFFTLINLTAASQKTWDWFWTNTMGGSLRDGHRHKNEWEQRLQLTAMGSRRLANLLDMTTSKSIFIDTDARDW